MNRFPNWLRWLLFLPLSIMGAILAFILVKLVTLLFDDFFLFQLLLILPASGLTGYIFVYGAAFLVPNLKVFISTLMTLSYGLLSYFIFIKKVFLVELIQLNSFEMICLTVLGTMAAIFASYQSYVNQKRITRELIESEREKQIKIALEKKKKVSDKNSDLLEDSIFQLIGDFDTPSTKPRRKKIRHETVSNRSHTPDRSTGIHKNDSIFPYDEDDVIVSDLESEDLEKEISDVMNVLDNDKTEVAFNSISEKKFSRHTESRKRHFKDEPGISIEPKIAKKKRVTSQNARELDKQISEIMLDIDPRVKEVQRKPAPTMDRSIPAIKTKKSSDTFKAKEHKKETKQHKPVVDKDVEKPEELAIRPQSSTKTERIKSRRGELPAKKKIDVKKPEAKDSAVKTMPPPIERPPEITAPKSEVRPEQTKSSRTDETGKSGDTLDTRQKQDLEEAPAIAHKDLKEKEKKESRPKIEIVPQKTETKKSERLEADKKHVPLPVPKKLEEKPLKSQAKSVPETEESRDDTFVEEQQIGIPEQKIKRSKISTDAAPKKASRDQTVETRKEPSDLEKKSEKAETKLRVAPEKPGTKQATADDIVISIAELDRLIEHYQDESLTEKPSKVEDILEHDIKKSVESEITDVAEDEPDAQLSEIANEELVSDPNESDNLEDDEADDSLLQELKGEDLFSYLNLEHLDESMIQTTTELDILIKESRINKFMKYIENYYKSVGEDETVALINTEIFHLWCMLDAVFDFSMDSEFRKNLIMFFNTRVGELYLKWKEFIKSNEGTKISIDFNSFSYYSNQVRTNKIHLNSSIQNTDAEILFGKIVLTKIHEYMGNKKLDVERETILMPVKVYYDLKHQVVEILNRTTNLICY